MGILDKGFFSLFSGINQSKATDKDASGPDGEEVGLLTLQTPDPDLLKIRNQYKSAWKNCASEIKSVTEKNRRYWLGDASADFKEDEKINDNRIFAAVETIIPIITRRNPEPVTTSLGDDASMELARLDQKILEAETDRQRLKLRLKTLVRLWMMSRMGCLKLGWSFDDRKPITSNIQAERLILDPSASIDEGGNYRGRWLGEIRDEMTAQELVERFPKKEKEIRESAKGEMGTRMKFEEWWSDEVVFWCLENTVLDKAKTPHWNYDIERVETKTDEFGNETQETVTDVGRNHLKRKAKPYLFLNVFTIEDKPYDETSLIEQASGQQEWITSLTRQIKRNVENINGGWIISGEKTGLNQDQAARAIRAFRKGLGLFIKQGSPSEGVQAVQGQALPGQVYESLVDARNSIDNIMGTHSTTRGERAQPETASGRILLKEQDESRISLISDRLEQLVDSLYNWWIHLYLVYGSVEDVADIVGDEAAVRWMTLTSDPAVKEPIISVKEGSLLPKDDVSLRNEAMDLWNAKALDPVTLFERLGFPNPQEATRKLIEWQTGQMAQPAVQPTGAEVTGLPTEQPLIP